MDFSIEVADLLLELKRFNYKPDFQRIHRCYEQLFDYYMGQMAHDPAAGDVGLNFLNSMSNTYIDGHPPAATVRDYPAGMTDDFFLRQAALPGCDIPERTCVPI